MARSPSSGRREEPRSGVEASPSAPNNGAASGFCKNGLKLISFPAESLPVMVNYILLYKIRKIVKRIIKDKIADDEIATTPKSCIGCLADDISWEVYYLLKEKEEKDGPPASEG